MTLIWRTFPQPVSAASEAITAAFGGNLATGVATPTTPTLPTTLVGTTVKVRDSAGTERNAPLFFVAPGQINFQIPPGTAEGATLITVMSSLGQVLTGQLQIVKVAPGIFSANPFVCLCGWLTKPSPSAIFCPAFPTGFHHSIQEVKNEL